MGPGAGGPRGCASMPATSCLCQTPHLCEDLVLRRCQKDGNDVSVSLIRWLRKLKACCGNWEAWSMSEHDLLGHIQPQRWQGVVSHEMPGESCANCTRSFLCFIWGTCASKRGHY